MNQLAKHKWWFFAGFIFVVAFSRLLPHPYNFTPVGGMALFAGALFGGRKMLWLVPLVAYLISDLLVNNILYASYYESFIWMTSPAVYLSLAAIILIGHFMLKRINAKNMVLASVSASVLFFLITNAFVWYASPTYPNTVAGLMSSYTAGIPFFWNTLAGDLFYCSLLFGSYSIWVKKYPAFRLKTQA